jgi:hypothetical protein
MSTASPSGSRRSAPRTSAGACGEPVRGGDLTVSGGTDPVQATL